MRSNLIALSELALLPVAAVLAGGSVLAFFPAALAAFLVAILPVASAARRVLWVAFLSGSAVLCIYNAAACAEMFVRPSWRGFASIAARIGAWAVLAWLLGWLAPIERGL